LESIEKKWQEIGSTEKEIQLSKGKALTYLQTEEVPPGPNNVAR